MNPLFRVSALLGALCGHLQAAPLPVVDLSRDTTRHVIIAQGTEKVYQGHPTTLLMPDGKTMFCLWTHGHGGTAGPLKRSDDGGKTWSEELPVPENWWKVKNCPAIYRLTDPRGVARLIVYAGQGPDGTMHQSVSTDDGKTWSPMRSNGLTCVMPFCAIVPVEGGKKLIGLTNIRRPGETKDPLTNVIAQSESTDGGLTWSPWRVLVDLGDLKPCEPEVIRSPDGKQLLCLMRENIRTEPAHFITSNDEGKTWSEVKALPVGLHGDRHKAVYAKDGRLVIAFRDTGLKSPTKNHFVAWVGRYEDIISGKDGEYKIKLLHSHKGSDCGYPGLELLPDGTLVATTYIKYRSGVEQNSVVSTRFTLAETDKAEKATNATAERKAAGIVLDDDAAKYYTGAGKMSDKHTPLVGASYRHDDLAKKMAAVAKFTPEIPADGKYEVRLLYVEASNRAQMAQITIRSADGEKHAGVIYTKERHKEPGQRGFPKAADEGTLNIRYNSHATADIVEGPQSGEADSSVMAYNYRLILTRDPVNRIMVSKPANYDPTIAKQAIGGGSIMGFNARLDEKESLLLSCDNITIRHCWIYDAKQAAGGTKVRNDDLLLLKSTDGGRTWSEPTTLFTGLFWNCHTGMVQRGDRLYWATDDLSLGNKRGPRVIAGDLSGDPMNPQAWRISEPVPFPGVPEAMTNPKFANLSSQYLEPNVIEVNGRLRGLATVKPKRQSTAGLAAVFDFEDKGGPIELKFTQFHPMPGGQLKFCVIWDEATQMFWATANLVVDGQGAFDWFREAEKRGYVRYASGLGGNDRRFLMLFYGLDGLNWFHAGCIAQAPKISQSFMHARPVIDGDDLAIIARSSINAPNQHDARSRDLPSREELPQSRAETHAGS
jgi:hypothetical protein